MKQKVLMIIKPDTVMRGLNEDVKKILEEKGFEIRKSALRQLTEEQCLYLQSEHVSGKDHATCADYMQTGPCEILILTKDNALRDIINLAGNADPKKAENGTIRSRFGIDGIHNSVYISPKETVRKEVSYFEKVIG